MIDKMSNYILDNLLYRNEKIEGDQREVMLFGITRIIEDIPKYIIIFLTSYFLNILEYVGVILAITLLYKGFVGGAHARTNLLCLISTLAYFIVPVYIAKYITIDKNMIYILSAIVFLVSLYIIIKIAPADTEEIPILKKSRRNLLKICAFISLCIILIFNLVVVSDIYIQKIVLLTVFLIGILATKPIYKLFRCKYSFESDEFKEFYNK